MRGLRHREYRPDYGVADDVESNDSVRTKEQRDKTMEWWSSEFMPAMDKEYGRVVLVGNNLHNDSLMSKQKKIIEKTGIGIYRRYPIVQNGEILWKERYNEEDLKRLRAVSSSRYYQREYELKLIPADGQVIKKVSYYTELPKIKALSLGVDLAISEKETADFTSANALARGIDNNFYNLKNIAGRWGFNTTLEQVHGLYEWLQKAFFVLGFPHHWSLLRTFLTTQSLAPLSSKEVFSA
ncbi:hypothetical protein LCGC14_2684030 [marine sediment metagenome]|uniref:Uncharacterized protein n=1 Tax=marine sediment metagenome TaxID=412755 RepID=A0A0F9BV56_9ZZZZ